jgi:hypothetical protein
MSFEKHFYNILEEDLLEPSKSWSQVAIRGLDRQDPSQIPASQKASGNTSETKISNIALHGGVCPCNNTDIQYIINKYKISNVDQPKQLGKTGVTLMKRGNVYILTR